MAVDSQSNEIVRSCPIPCLVFSSEQDRILVVNDSAVEVYGYSRLEFEGLNIRELAAAQSQTEWNIFIHSRQLGTQSENFLHRKRDGGEIKVAVKAVQLQPESSSLLMLFLDKRDSQELLSETALRKAEAALRMKSNFLATISHEIRTPMNGVLGMTALLGETALTTEQRDLVEVIRSSSEILLAVVNDFLDFTKIDEGKLSLEIIDFDLTDVLDDVMDVVSEAAHNKGLTMHVSIQPSLQTSLAGDPLRLRQVLLNLLSNAAKFTVQGSIHLYVERASSDAPFVYRFRIVDTGIGISPGHLQHLFQPFSQEDSSITRRFGGTGLGLVIVKRLVEAMNGKINVESRLGSGSTFSITVPFSRPEVLRNLASSDQWKNQPVLIVDPMVEDRRELCLLLEENGLVVREAANGPEALSLFSRCRDSQQAPKLVITARFMPVMAGDRLGQVLQAQMGSAAPAIVGLTYSRTTAADWSSVFSHQLIKPVRSRQLLAILQQVFAPEPGKKSGKAGPLGPYQSSRKILVVDDNLTNQKVALGFLRSLGYQGDIAANGLEALDRLARESYDLVLMDCHMPLMDGFAATQAIRALEGAVSEIPVIALTADVLESGRDRCLQIGMNAFLSKPLRRDALLQMLQRYLPDEANFRKGVFN